MSGTWSSPCTAFTANATTLRVCMCQGVWERVCMCAWLLVQERAAGVTARPLPKVMSKENQANYYADQNWWRLKGLLQCNHISWPERNLQADPNHRVYSARVSQDGGLPPMFSFHKTLFPYLRQAHDYQTKQDASSTFLHTCTCIYILKNASSLQQIQHTQIWHLGYKKRRLAGPNTRSSEWCQGVSQCIISQFITLFNISPSAFSHADTQVCYKQLILLSELISLQWANVHYLDQTFF